MGGGGERPCSLFFHYYCTFGYTVCFLDCRKYGFKKYCNICNFFRGAMRLNYFLYIIQLKIKKIFSLNHHHHHHHLPLLLHSDPCRVSHLCLCLVSAASCVGRPGTPRIQGQDITTGTPVHLWLLPGYLCSSVGKEGGGEIGGEEDERRL